MEGGPIICSLTAVCLLDEFLTCQKFWSADADSRKFKAELRVDYPTPVPFLHLCKVANRASENAMATRRWTESTEAGLVELWQPYCLLSHL